MNSKLRIPLCWKELVFGGQRWRIKTPLELNRDEVRLILFAEDLVVIYRATESGVRRVTERGEPRVLE